MASKSAIPRVLVLSGLVIIAAGVVIVVFGVHLHHNCLTQHGAVNGMNVELSLSQCSGYQVVSGVGWFVMLGGAGLVLLAALADTPRWRDRRLLRPSPN